MSSQQSIENLIADRYAFALYELSSETNCVDEVLSDLKIINKYFINMNDIAQNSNRTILRTRRVGRPVLSALHQITLYTNTQITGYIKHYTTCLKEK